MSSIASPTTTTRRAAICVNSCSRWSRVSRGSGWKPLTGALPGNGTGRLRRTWPRPSRRGSGGPMSRRATRAGDAWSAQFGGSAVRGQRLRSRGRGVRFRAHVSAPGPDRGGARHHVRRTHRAVRGGTGAGDRVLETDPRAPGNGRTRVVRGERGAWSGTLRYTDRNRSPLPAPVDDLVGRAAGVAFLVLDRLAPVHQRRQLGCPRVAQARLRLGPRGGVAARASDAHGSLGHRARGGR